VPHPDSCSAAKLFDHLVGTGEQEGGTVRPSALVAFMLITNSNLVGCSTGRSEGSVPFEDLIDIADGNSEWI
jgi:hypothetical protein